MTVPPARRLAGQLTGLLNITVSALVVIGPIVEVIEFCPVSVTRPLKVTCEVFWKIALALKYC
jgi:hypothetical protein